MRLAATILLLVNYFIVSGQNQINFAFKEGIELKLSNSEPITYNIYNNKLFYCNSRVENIVNNTVHFVVYTYDIALKQSDSLILDLPNSETLKMWTISAIAVSNKNIALKGDSIYVFSLQKKIIKILPAHFCDEMLFAGDNRLLLLKNYNSHPLDDSVRTKMIIVNFNTGKVEKYLTPHFNYIVYSHLVNNFFSSSNGSIAFSQTIPYKIDIYSSSQLQKTSEITGVLKNEEGLIQRLTALQSSSNKKYNAKKYIYDLRSVDSSITRIEKTIFLNDSTILVSKKFPKSGFEKRLLNVWRRNRGKWTELVQDELYVTERSEKESYFITNETLPLNLTYSNKLLASNSNLLTVNSKIPPPMKINSAGLKKFYDDYYAGNELNYYLWVYTWEIK